MGHNGVCSMAAGTCLLVVTGESSCMGHRHSRVDSKRPDFHHFEVFKPVSISRFRQVFLLSRLIRRLLLILFTVAALWAVIRYRYLTKYSRLPEEQSRQEPIIDFFEPRDDERKEGLRNYLDDFLSAIKIFGYLDKKVFHELTKQLRTIKLEAGEIVHLSDIKGFSIVIDGTVEVFAKAAVNSQTFGAPSSRTVMQLGDTQYQLLNEVRKGAPLSSLFSILSLFTEDVQLNDNLRRNTSPFNEDSVSSPQDESELPHLSLDDPQRHDSITSPMESPGLGATSPRFPPSSPRGYQGRSSFSTSKDYRSYSHNARRPSSKSFKGSKKQGSKKKSKPLDSDFDVITEDIVCRARVDSTIAILPGEAFQILTKKYPKAASHMVQVILTRCQRVTFGICHSYFGMTSHIFQAEATINSKAKYELPAYIRNAAIRKLRDKAMEDDSKKVFLPPMKRTTKTRTSSASSNVRPPIESRLSRQVVLSPDVSHPGDLLSTVPLSRVESGQHPAANHLASPAKAATLKFTGDDETEDSIMRTALVEGIFKLLGFDSSLVQKSTSSGIASSIEASPMFAPIESANHFRMRASSHSSSGPMIASMSRLEFDSNFSDVSSVEDQKSTKKQLPSYDNAQQEAANYLEVMYCKEGSILCHQNERSPGLFYVIDGVLEVGYRDEKYVYDNLFEVRPGGIAGFIGSIIGQRSFVEVRAKTDVYVGMLSRTALEKIIEKYPMMYITFAKTLTSVLNRLILDLDFGFEWVQIEASQSLLKQGEEADAMYFVLSGRLRGVAEDRDGKVQNIEEYGNGDSIGELEVLVSGHYNYNLNAIRDSELARLPKALLESLAMRYPPLTFEITKVVASRLEKSMKRNHARIPTTGGISSMESSFATTYRTITVLPINPDMPASEFSEKLVSAFLYTNRSCTLVNNSSMLGVLGRHAFNKLGHLKLNNYLADLEDRFETVVYVADTGVKSPWTKKCINQADCILLLADAHSSPDFGEYEHLLVRAKVSSRIDLVLLHPERNVIPGSTNAWLKNRIWVYSHHHVQFDATRRQNVVKEDKRVASGKLAKIRSRVLNIQSGLMTKYGRPSVGFYSNQAAHKNDFNRLARILSGQAVGLVLGGGGARGISHIGIIRALEDNGIPIDFVGGTSIGAFVGGLYAKDYEIVQIYGRAKKFAQRVSSLWRMALDLTYPATSYTTGHEFNRGIWKAFGDTRIEDFWLRYYTNTTNITHSRKEIHISGYSWRYIRASMSLAGLLPPLTDKGSMLLDGGYVDNLTVSQMQSWGAKHIFAVDVGSIDDTTPMEYGDTLSGLWVILNRWNFFGKHPNVPNMAEIQQRLAYVSSVGELERAKTAPGVIYMRPPIDDYATLDFGKFEEIYDTGARYGHDFLKKLEDAQKMPQIPGATITKGGNKKEPMARRNSI